jgi:hypothetical protein
MIMDSLEKWKRAVIHLEGAADSQPPRLLMESLANLHKRSEEGEDTLDEMSECLKRGIRDLRFQGTAVFIQHEDHRYLLTARHVVWDRLSAEREAEEQEQHWSEKLPQAIRADLLRRVVDRVFPIIFRVPSLDEILTGGEGVLSPGMFLMNLSAGGAITYTFSDPRLDLAVISLDQRPECSEFADNLVSQGYVPATIDDIVDAPSAQGAEVFTVGFPGAVAKVGERGLGPAARQWASNDVSIPAFSFGRVSMLHHSLPFYWCDMSIYPGYSGGPVVEDGRLVGIISEQAVTQGEILSMANGSALPLVATTRMPFGKSVKGKYVKDLLNDQIRKDADYGRRKRPGQ